MAERWLIYTDGACRGNPGPGGWGAVLYRVGEKNELSGAESNTTNNRMELTAPVEALDALPASSHVSIYTDSQYVKNGITLWISNWKQNGWKTSNGKQVKLKGKGFPVYKKEGQFGDLFITYDLKMPQNLSAKEKEQQKET